MAVAKIAFSGGMESTYLAQLFLEKEWFDTIRLYFGAISGVTPDPLEASLVYRNYKKLVSLYPNKRITLFYVNKNYFDSSQCEAAINLVNQAFRVACLCTDITSESGNFLVACGWTGDGDIESTLNLGGYTKNDYLEMLEFPRKISHLTRGATFPHTILAPLWGMTKKEIFNKLNPELRDYVVVNNRNGEIVDNKLDEYDSAGIVHPNYITNKRINADVINSFGKYFYSVCDWQRVLGETVSSPYKVLELLTPTHNQLARALKAEEMVHRVDSFEEVAKELLIAYDKYQTQK